jgi:hypothetical protein
MKLWLIDQDENGEYDTYDSAVVAAETENEARKTHPSGKNKQWSRDWASCPEKVQVRYIGEAASGIEAGVILASFNAG